MHPPCILPSLSELVSTVVCDPLWSWVGVGVGVYRHVCTTMALCMTCVHELDAVRDCVSGGQRVAHGIGTLCYAVRDDGGVCSVRHGPSSGQCIRQHAPQAIKVMVAGHVVAVGQSQGDNRFEKISVLPPCRAVIGTGSSHLDVAVGLREGTVLVPGEVKAGALAWSNGAL